MNSINDNIRCVLVDLEKQKTNISEFSLQDIPDLVGGWSVQYVLWKKQWEKSLKKKDKYPMLGLSTGPVTGTGAPASAGFNWCTLGESGLMLQQAEGRLGAELRYAGFDHVLFCGRSSEPVHIRFTDERVDILSAVEYSEKTAEAIYELMISQSLESGRVVVTAEPDGLLEDKYFTIGTSDTASVLAGMNVKAITAFGLGKIRIAEPEDFLNLCIGLYQDYRKNKGNEKNQAGPFGYYLSPWRSVQLNDDNRTDLAEARILNLIDTDLGNQQVEDIVFALLGLCWNETFPPSSRLEHAARLLSSIQGKSWSATQLNEMALRIIRINQEFLS
ncbi:MAG: hypothetical protein GX808_12960 [Syntrophomonadaceae bacterium]|jgi:aldehyde:ferredoxin oxidoreductase|nr:hypothetical protein [Syntrophomonadaceae bacterium]